MLQLSLSVMDTTGKSVDPRKHSHIIKSRLRARGVLSVPLWRQGKTFYGGLLSVKHKP